MDVFEFCLGQERETRWFLEISPSVIFNNPSRSSHLLKESKIFGLLALLTILLSTANRACGSTWVTLDAGIGVFHLLPTGKCVDKNLSASGRDRFSVLQQHIINYKIPNIKFMFVHLKIMLYTAILSLVIWQFFILSLLLHTFLMLLALYLVI